MITPAQPDKKYHILYHRKLAIRIMLSLFLAWMSALAIQRWLVDLYQVSNRSMLPTLAPGDLVIIDKISPGLILLESPPPGGFTRWKYPLHRRLQIDDLIIFFSPLDNTPLVKRVKALKPEGIIVEGDNHKNSLDCREFGPFSESRVIGRVISAIKERAPNKKSPL